jgi:DNA invertase Pin-like site-specific DNA recombinase
MAVVYVRQSSMGQVRHHLESRRRQYDLAGQAKSLGFVQVEVIDEDLGKSGASAVGRLGFQRLVAEVSLGRVGAVFGLEVSRLARNNRDWYQLLDLCGLMNTLIVDAEGIYDPRQLNDRLLLGLKGTMSEAELGWIKQRAHEGLLAKARRGELILGLPVGFEQDRGGGIEKTSDRRVQEAIELVFKKFTELGSMRQVLLWFRQERIGLPVREEDSRLGNRVTWRLPIYNTILRILQNPIYAGAYAFGRTGTRTSIVDGTARKTRGHRRDSDEWIALLQDHHEGYIPWETYERNQSIIADNAQMKGIMVKGAVRQGKGLLAGLLRCGHCGRRFHVCYCGSDGTVVRYSCRGAMINHGSANCISFGGTKVDAAFESEILRVLTPGAIEAAMENSTRAAEETTEKIRMLELELREAKYQAQRAQRQYDVVEPENRLVAETLEQRWNAAMEHVQFLENHIVHLAQEKQRQLPPDRAMLLSLAREFPEVWSNPNADNRTKKRLVRLLVEEIVARLPSAAEIEFIIHWKGGKHSRLLVPRNRTGKHSHATDREIIDIVRDLARILPDGRIANVLNRLRFRTGAGNTWVQGRVASLRAYHGIKAFDPIADGATTLTIEKAAVELGVSKGTVRKMILTGILPARQPVALAPWAIKRDDLAVEKVQKTAEAIKKGNAFPRHVSESQQTLINSNT